MLSKIRSSTRGFLFPPWSVPIALLALTLLSYGLRAFSLGFFWDDWPYLWYFHRLGPAGIVAAFAQDRPFLSLIYNATLSLLGSSVQAWQGFALLARWLCSLGLWWALAQAWPRHTHKAAWAACLFAVYPGFTQQWIAVIYGQAFFLYAALFFSIGLTLWLARRRAALARWKLAAVTLLALALSAFTMFSTEYFFGLELLRPVLLWLALAGTARGGSGEGRVSRRAGLRRRLADTAAWWLPYLGLMLLFVAWRVLVHTFPSATLTTIEGIGQSPLGAARGLFQTVLEDLVEATLAAWGQPLQLSGFIESAGAFAGMRLLAVIAGAALLAGVYLSRLCPARGDPSLVPGALDRWGWQAVAAGLFALLAAGWPFWITGLPMRMGFPQDRYTLPLAPGVSLLLAGLVDLLGGSETFSPSLARKAVVLGAMIGLAAGFHNDSALAYRQDWHAARDFFWQLTWRAPGVQAGTLFLTAELPFQFFEDDSLTSPINWTYDPGGSSTRMGYMLYDLNVRQHSLTVLQPGQPVRKDFRATLFEGSTSQVLALYYRPPGCVRVLDLRYDAELYGLPESLQRALPLSAPGKWIQAADPAAEPPTIFGAEPRRSWCYYFEKAELARQNQDWDTIYRLGSESIKEGLRPEDPAEYLPFVEGYLRFGLQDDAYQLTVSAYQGSWGLRPALCSVWRRAAQAGVDVRDTYRAGLKDIYQCTLP
jgi:hypothetical protein